MSPTSVTRYFAAEDHEDHEVQGCVHALNAKLQISIERLQEVEAHCKKELEKEEEEEEEEGEEEEQEDVGEHADLHAASVGKHLSSSSIFAHAKGVL